MNTMDWVNIPATYLLIAYLCALNVTALAHPRRRGRGRLLLANLVTGALYALTLYSSPRAEGLRFFACMGVIWAGMPLFLKACVDASWLDALYYAVRAFFLGDFSASLAWQLAYYALSRSGAGDRVLVSLLVLVPVCGGMSGISFLLEHRLQKKLYDLRMQPRDLLAALFTGVFLYFMANISYVLSDSPFSTASLTETYVRRTLTEFGAVAILLAYHILLIDQQNQWKAQAMENALRLQEEHYRAYEGSIALVNRKYHDMKHQLRLLRQSVSTREKLDYIENMERELTSYEAQYDTGSATLDTILTATGLECARAEIAFTCVADGRALSQLHPLDLNALFGNLLDNAIECETKIAEPERRMIHLSVNRLRSFVQIRVRNFCAETVDFRDGLPVSTKGDARYHGFGTRSAREIVEKYEGSILFACEDGWFTVSIMLPAEP